MQGLQELYKNSISQPVKYMLKLLKPVKYMLKLLKPVKYMLKLSKPVKYMLKLIKPVKYMLKSVKTCEILVKICEIHFKTVMLFSGEIFAELHLCLRGLRVSREPLSQLPPRPPVPVAVRESAACSRGQVPSQESGLSLSQKGTLGQRKEEQEKRKNESRRKELEIDHPFFYSPEKKETFSNLSMFFCDMWKRWKMNRF